jgi:hypothetical protein
LLLDEDDLKDVESFFAKLRRERRQEPIVYVARVACAIAAALVGVGAGFWPLGLVLGALALLAKRARRLAFGCLLGLLFAVALLIDAITADSNVDVALLFYGGSAALFALGLALVLTTGVTLFRHSAVRRLEREHDVDGLIALLPNYDSYARRDETGADRGLSLRQAAQYRWTMHLGARRTVPRARVIDKEKSAQSGDRTLAQARSGAERARLRRALLVTRSRVELRDGDAVAVNNDLAARELLDSVRLLDRNHDPLPPLLVGRKAVAERVGAGVADEPRLAHAGLVDEGELVLARRRRR